MTKEVFLEYISNVFYPHIIKNNIKLPVILFVDGHVTHLTYELSILCNKLQIILISLYPNATRILQPCDVAAFKPLKSAWQKVVLNWRRDNVNNILTRETFAPLLQQAVNKAVNPVTIINGFKACGIYPFNKYAVDYSKCLGKSGLNEDIHQTGQRSFNPVCDTNGNTINVEQFSDIVGTKLLELQSIEESELILKTEEFRCLHKIYKALTPSANLEMSPNIMDINEFIYLPEEFTIEEIESTEQVECMEQMEREVYTDSTTLIGNTEQEKVSELSEKRIEPENCAELCVKTIDQYVRWPKTPERKNERKFKEKLPFVITSSGYAKIQEEKKKQKLEMEIEKEHRQLLRIENKKNKEKIREEKSNNKPKRKTNSKNLPKKIMPIKKLTFNEFVPLEHLSDKQKGLTSLHNNVTVTITSKGRTTASLTQPNQFEETLQKAVPLTTLTSIPSTNTELPDPYEDNNNSTSFCNNETITKILELSDTDLLSIPNEFEEQLLTAAPISNLTTSSSTTLDILMLEQKERNNEKYSNTLASGKMCYHCTYTIHKNNKGLRCAHCTTEFHISCINK